MIRRCPVCDAVHDSRADVCADVTAYRDLAGHPPKALDCVHGVALGETAVLADRVTDALWTLRAACTDDDDRHLVDVLASQLFHRFQSADRAANQQVSDR